jgi:hypothetical protein
MTDTSMLPPRSKRGWLWIMLVFSLLAATGVTLTLLYRDYTTPEEITVRERRRNAEAECFTVVYSRVPSDRAARIIEDITADIGADTVRTDLILGSTVEDPWSQSMSDYRSKMARAMREAKDLPIGKQTLVLSMIAGILTKTDMRSQIYLVGSLSDTLTPAIIERTKQTVEAFEIRNKVMGQVTVISYLDTSVAANREYVRLFEGRTFPLTKR